MRSWSHYSLQEHLTDTDEQPTIPQNNGLRFMWEFIKNVGKFIKWSISALAHLAELFSVGAEVLNLRSVMLLNSVNIKNKQPLNTLKEHKDLSKLTRDTAIYTYGIRQLDTSFSVDALTRQHDALVNFIDNLDKHPPQDDYTYEVQQILSGVLLEYTKNLKSKQGIKK